METLPRLGFEPGIPSAERLLRSTMKASLFVMILLASGPHRYSALHVKDAIIHEPVTLDCCCNESSQNATWSKLVNRKYVNFKVGETKHSRVAFTGDTSKGNYSVTFNRTVYNDSGWYRCSCDSNDTKLQVLDPVVVTASVEKNVFLKCYGQGFEDVIWMKDGQEVWPKTPANKNISGRFGVFPEESADGHFFLHIRSVQPSDAGLYRCFFNQQTKDGEPRAVSLNVHNSTSNNESPPSANNYSALTIIVIVIVVGGIFFAIIYIGLYFIKIRKGKKTFETKASVQETELLEVKMSSTQPF